MTFDVRKLIYEDEQVLSALECLARGSAALKEIYYYPGDAEYENAEKMILSAWGQYAFPPLMRTLSHEKRDALMKLYRSVKVEKRLSPAQAIEARRLFASEKP
ncbi:MAG: hypothetical protein ACP5O3_02155 [Candidatus Micrarchaeia archaeon]|jgi:hypothetical protein